MSDLAYICTLCPNFQVFFSSSALERGVSPISARLHLNGQIRIPWRFCAHYLVIWIYLLLLDVRSPWCSRLLLCRPREGPTRTHTRALVSAHPRRESDARIRRISDRPRRSGFQARGTDWDGGGVGTWGDAYAELMLPTLLRVMMTPRGGSCATWTGALCRHRVGIPRTTRSLALH
ncbi:hypothetical protein F5883DRAFT_531104 [Diaporthe sp. PMI_573]|nr:hypothetical protein F5883DRAFT_531104 [Diaporthaceae sp. PMI_573]